MSKALIIITLTIAGFMLFLSGCGDETTEITAPEADASTSATIEIPMAFANRLSQTGITVRATVSAADINTPIVHTQNISLVPSRGQSYDLILNDLPVGNNRTLLIEISRRGDESYVVFDWEGPVNLTASGPNNVEITLVSALQREILGTWELTNEFGINLVADFRENGRMTLELAGISIAGRYEIWGDQITIEIQDQDPLFGTARVVRDTVTITYDDGTVEIYRRI